MAMRLDELRAKVYAALGARLERATPEAIRDCLQNLYSDLPGPKAGGVVLLDGAPASYGAAMREYFGAVLEADPDAAAVSLWVTALEMWLGEVEAEAADATGGRAP